MITTMMMMIRSSTENSQNKPIPTSTIPTWKLYENPFYTSPQHLPHQQNQEKETEEEEEEEKSKQIHHIHLPISTRKIAASFWDLTFIKPFMESELDVARAHVVELKAQVEYESKARKKMESANKKLAKELAGERKGREALEKVCEELAKEISNDKTEIARLKREIEEERKMLRVAEVLREERVQMKLGEAKLLLEEKLLELEAIRTRTAAQIEPFKNDQENHLLSKRTVLCENSSRNNNGGIVINSMPIQKRVSLEAENPHIKRGIKGFVEFPRVVRAIGSKSRHLGTKLECQKAQLMILLKHKSPIRSNNLIMS